MSGFDSLSNKRAFVIDEELEGAKRNLIEEIGFLGVKKDELDEALKQTELIKENLNSSVLKFKDQSKVLSELNSEILKKKKELEGLSVEIGKITSEISVNKSRLENSNSGLENLETTKKMFDLEIQNKGFEIKHIDEKIAKLNNVSNEIENKTNSKQREFNNLEEEVRLKRIKLESELEKNIAIVDHLNKEIKDLTLVREDANNCYENLKSKNTEMIKQIKENEISAQKLLEDAEEELNDRKTQLDNREKELEIREGEVHVANFRLETKKEQLIETKRNLEEWFNKPMPNFHI